MAEGKSKDRDLFTIKKRKISKFTQKRKKKKADDNDWFVVPEKHEKDSSQVFLEPLSHRSLMEGLITLGCISKISQYYLVVSLPYRITGRVSITRISQAYTTLLKEITKKEGDENDDAEVLPLQSLFKVGQHVAVKVEHIVRSTGKLKVNLSLMPREVNFGISAPKLKKGIVLPCAVASIEDNGYVMETGISSVRAAFMNRAKAEGAGISGIGSIVRCLITQAQHTDDKESVQLKLSAVPDEVNNALLDVVDTDDFCLLIPGTAIKSVISQGNQKCLKILLAEYDGVIGPRHLSTPLDSLSHYKAGQEVTARVLYVTPLSRIIHLTLQTDIFVLKSEEELWHGMKMGDRMQGVVLFREPLGVNIKFNNCLGYCPNLSLRESDEKINIRAHFAAGSEHEVCVLSYCHFDRTFLLTLQKSVMREQTLGLNTLTVGQILKATIKSYKKNRAVVSISSKVEGCIPLMHLTDSQIDHPEKKFPVGSTVMTRVLEVNPKHDRLILTSKKLLVYSKGPVVSEYRKDLVNQIVDGFVGQIYEAGLLLVFYNNIKGFVPKSLTIGGKKGELDKQFKIGNVLKAKIVSVEPEIQRMTLSLILDEEQNKSVALEPKKQKGKNSPIVVEEQTKNNPSSPLKSGNVFSVGSSVRCIVKNINEDVYKVLIKPGNLKADIPYEHLADDRRRRESLKKIIRVGDKIENAVVFKKGPCKILTLKESICLWIHRVKASVQKEFKESQYYAAVVTEVMATGAKVDIPVGVSGQNVPLSLNAEAANDLVVGQCINLKCEGFHEDEEHGPIFSIQSKYKKKKTKARLQELFDHLQFQRLQQMNKVRKGYLSCDFANMDIGVKLHVEVIAVLSLGLLVKNSWGTIPGIILKNHCPLGVKYEVGDTLKACVLYVHINEKCLILTAKNILVKNLHTADELKIKVGQQVKCQKLFVEKTFILARLTSYKKNLMVYIPYSKKAAVRKNFNITVKFVQGNYVFGITKAQEKWGLQPVIGKMPNFSLKFPEVGYNKKRKMVDYIQQCSLKKLKKIAFLPETLSEGEDFMDTSLEEKAEHLKDPMEIKEIAENLKETNGTVEEAVNKEGNKKTKKKKTVKEKNETGIKTVNKDVKKKKNINNEASKKGMKKNCTNTNREIGSNEAEELKNTESSKKTKKRKKEESKTSKEEPTKKKKKKADNNKDKGSAKEEAKSDDSVDSGVDESMMSDNDKPKITKQSKPCLKVGSGFVWDVPENEGDPNVESSSDEDDEDAAKKKTKKLSRVEREMLAKEEENRLHDLEKTRLEKERLPQSALDFEELLQQSPNSSAIWIQFISYYLENAEIEQARSVAQRALQLINIEEYEERINIWTVLLRLEVLYGTEESTNEAFKEALATNDPLKIYLAMAMVYSESNKLKEAEDTYFKMTKKFSHKFDVWIKAGIFLFKNGRLEDARKHMVRALLSLDKTEHVNLINRFGQLEFQFGEVERARTIFESLLSNYPTRMDIWSVYVDLLAKKGDIKGARQVLERMTNLKLRLRRMRFVFRKFVEFEKQHGTTQTVEAVKNRVQEYVAASLQE